LRLIWPWQDRKRRFSWLKASTLALMVLPTIRFAYQARAGEFGILPIALGGMADAEREVIDDLEGWP
jgi:hypothetical protein